jgi:hypothetical protein
MYMMPARLYRWFVGGLLLVVLLVVEVRPVIALNSCTATVTPHNPGANSTNLDFTFSVTNTDSVDVKWFRIWKPTNDAISMGTTTLSGWYKDFDVEHRTFRYYQDLLSPGETLNPIITSNVGDIEGFSGTWWVEADDDPMGINSVYCTGDLSINVGAEQDTTGPVISGVAVVNIETTSVTVTWTTDELSDSKVEYTTIPEEWIYQYQGYKSSMVTAHSVQLSDGLAAGNAYYYRVTSVDGSSNSTTTDELSFTTAVVEPTSTPTPVPGATVTPTPISAPGATAAPTPTPTPVPTPVPTPTPVPDTTPPAVIFETKLMSALQDAVEIRGRVSDNKQLLKVEYSVDDGENWLPVDEGFDQDGLEGEFGFTPEVTQDGNYELRVRVTDVAGNQTVSEAMTLVIDRMPPKLGARLSAVGPQVLEPTDEGVLMAVAGVEHRVVLSALGGPVSVEVTTRRMGDLNSGVQRRSDEDGEAFVLKQDKELGLWSGNVVFDEAGVFSLSATMIDGADNTVTDALYEVVVLPAGRVLGEGGPLGGAEVTVYVKEPAVVGMVREVLAGSTEGNIAKASLGE